LRFSILEAVAPDGAVALDLDVEPARQGVDHRHADAVESAGDLVGFVVELAAGVEDGHDDLDGGAIVLFVGVDRDPATVVGDRHGAVGVEGDLDPVTVAGEGLVDRVVDDLVDEVVEPAGVRRSDVHRRTFPDGLQAFQHLDLAGSVVCVL